MYDSLIDSIKPSLHKYSRLSENLERLCLELKLKHQT